MTANTAAPGRHEPPGGKGFIASQDDHERVARAVIAENPDAVRQAVATGNYLPLVRIAVTAEPGLVKFWLAARLGQLARAFLTSSPSGDRHD